MMVSSLSVIILIFNPKMWTYLSLTGFFNSFVKGDRHAEFISASFMLLKTFWPRKNYHLRPMLTFFPLFAAGHGTLERQSTQNASSIQQCGSSAPAFIKKTVVLRFVFNFRTSVETALMNTKALRFRFGNAICSLVYLFF